ncbi:MAG: N-6 DNA methylase [Hespellia sp.]|nr:N-6 DNA methylase [Hespellia sp.]
MISKKNGSLVSFEEVYKKLEEVMLANSGENEFEEIFKMVVLKLWNDLHLDENISNLNNANDKLTFIDGTWKGVLVDTCFGLTEEQFQVCIEIVNVFNFTSYGYEGIDGIFEYLISKEKKGAKGQYFTPRYIVDFCVKIINPHNEEKILDPAAGSGAFLYHSFLNGAIDGKNLWGFDFDNTAVRISRLLLYVGKVEGFHIHKVNSLIKNGARTGRFETGLREVSTTIEDILRIEKQKELFDIVITNPPFAGEIVEPDILQSYCNSYGKHRIERDVLFIERCIDLLKPEGRMAIVLPDNIFGSKENKNLRKWIYDKCRIVGVVGIPRNTFMPHTSVKTSVLFLQKRIGKRCNDEKIFFGISEKAGKDSRGKAIYKSDDNISWKNVEHDLADVYKEFHLFLKQEGIEW